MSLPTWQANVGYEEGQDWVVKKMECGYPRFFVHPIIQKLATEIVQRVGNPETETATLFATHKASKLCYAFIESKLPAAELQKVRIASFVPAPHTETGSSSITSSVFCVIYPKEHFPIAKQVWQHAGNGISSRRGEFCLRALQDGFLVEDKSTSAAEYSSQRPFKGPRRYRGRGSLSGVSFGGPSPSSGAAANGAEDGRDYSHFIEERFGRNLNSAHADKAKTAIRRRIAGVLTADGELNETLNETSAEGRVADISEDDVFLYSTGMNAIFNCHQMLLSARGSLKSICFGFPYTDTLKILQKWGPGCLFYGHGSSEDIDDIESRLKNGEKFLGIFMEAPSNPLLKTPDLRRIRALATQYDFAVVVDETISNFLNINILPHADMVASSLTKIFSGDSNVMGGSTVLNPHGQYYQKLKETFKRDYEDLIWDEDAVFLERNSRDFVTRIDKINSSSENITAMLKESPLGKLQPKTANAHFAYLLAVKEVYYPKYSPTRPLYDSLRNPNGGYGGLFSVTFHSEAGAIAFFDNLEVLKGPSLGTNFTLA